MTSAKMRMRDRPWTKEAPIIWGKKDLTGW
jgi:hypothetical protein